MAPSIASVTAPEGYVPLVLACAQFHLSYQPVWRLCLLGDVRHWRHGRRIYVLLADLERIDAQRRRTEALERLDRADEGGKIA